jgi:ribosomal protein L6P/L9E
MRTVIIEGTDKRSVAEIVAAVREAGRKAQADLPGLSFAETFDLTATPEGRGRK